MKCTYIKLAATVGILLGVGMPFFASASTFYQQLTDSSGSVSFPNTVTEELVGQFLTASTTLTINASSTGLAVFNPMGSTAALQLDISTSSQYDSAVTSYAGVQLMVGDQEVFLDLTGANPGTLLPNTEYYVWAFINVYYSGNYLRTNLSGDEFYGYLTDSSGTSLPIVPGIPGFSDVGISTTSQQVYCNANFSASSSLLSDTAQGISVAFCNVGVFLFVPSSISLQQMASLEPMMETKAPFSWVFGTVSTWAGLQASTTLSVPEYSIDMDAMDFSSSTALGPILPSGNFDLLSSSTINQYLPAGIHDALYDLAEIAIALTAVGGMFYEARRVFS